MLTYRDATIAGRDGREAPDAGARPGRGRYTPSLRQALAAFGAAPWRLHRYRNLRARALDRALRRNDDC